LKLCCDWRHHIESVVSHLYGKITSDTPMWLFISDRSKNSEFGYRSVNSLISLIPLSNWNYTSVNLAVCYFISAHPTLMHLFTHLLPTQMQTWQFVSCQYCYIVLVHNLECSNVFPYSLSTHLKMFCLKSSLVICHTTFFLRCSCFLKCILY
jgi:hypothetical protein